MITFRRVPEAITERNGERDVFWWATELPGRGDHRKDLRCARDPEGIQSGAGRAPMAANAALYLAIFGDVTGRSGQCAVGAKPWLQ